MSNYTVLEVIGLVTIGFGVGWFLNWVHEKLTATMKADQQ